jgi:hypothetical protein
LNLIVFGLGGTVATAALGFAFSAIKVWLKVP